MEYLMGDSECSSGCESGWTLYLDNSFVSPCENGHGFVGNVKKAEEVEEEEEEDMSMVSDASSGPPHFHEEEDFDSSNKCFYHQPLDDAALLSKKNRAKKHKFRENKRRTATTTEVHEKSSLLDDTASSPVFQLPRKNFNHTDGHHASPETLLDVSSKGYSTTLFEGSSAYQNPHGYFQYSSLSGNYLQQNQWFGSRTWQQ